MVIDCCAQQRSYEKFFGLLGQVIFVMTFALGLVFILDSVLGLDGEDWMAQLTRGD